MQKTVTKLSMLIGFTALVYFSAWSLAQYATGKAPAISTLSCQCGEATAVGDVRVFSCECGIQQCVISVHGDTEQGSTHLECSRI